MSDRMRLGVFGGTFDPVHLGHLVSASEMREACRLDQVWWVPAGSPPHKPGVAVSSDADRLAMLRLALENDPGAVVSTADLGRAGPSYTVDLLRRIRAEQSDADLVFLMGGDSLRDLPTWHDPQGILEIATLAVARRPGVSVDLDAVCRAVPNAAGRTQIVDVPMIGISATDIRGRVRSGRTIQHLVPASVEAYIRERGLYLTGI